MGTKEILLCFALVIPVTLSNAGFAKPQKIKDSSDRFYQHGFSVLPPQEKGWSVVFKNDYYLSMTKRGKKKYEKYTAAASLFQLSGIETEEEFSTLIQERRANIDKGRFQVLENEEQLFDAGDDYCVKHYSKTEDHVPPKKSSKRAYMILENIGFSCRHPRNKTVGITFEYSHFHYPEHYDPDFEDKAMRFLEQVQYTDF